MFWNKPKPKSSETSPRESSGQTPKAELDRDEVFRAFDVIRGLGSLEEFKSAATQLPILRHPTFHAILNGNFNASDISPANKAVINRFFLALATDTYFSYCDNPLPCEPVKGGAQRYLPYIYQAILHHLGQRTPQSGAYSLDPSKHMERLRQEVNELAGTEVTLPDYRPLEGTRWSVVVAVCASCRRLRLEPVANMIDLTIAKQLVEPLRTGRLNNICCPLCGQIRTIPTRIWISEDPFAPDALAALSSIVRVKEDSWIYLPPPGTPREARTDKLNEVRSMAMFRTYPWKFGGRGGQSMNVRFSIAYDRDTLLRQLS